MKTEQKTTEQIQAEIDTLRDMKPKVRHSDAFGNDNHAKIDAQIRALEECLEDEEIDDLLDSEEFTDDEASSARYAAYWMNGAEDEPPSKGWEPLVEKS